MPKSPVRRYWPTSTRSFSTSLLALALSVTWVLPPAAAAPAPTDVSTLRSRSFQPRIGDWLLGAPMSAQDRQLLELSGAGHDPAVTLNESQLAMLDNFIATAEAAFPGLVFVFMGRDTAPLAQAVDVRLSLRGEAGRVINLPLSRGSINAMTEGEIVEFLTQQGLRPRLGEGVRPYILVDRTEYKRKAGDSSQITDLTSAFYRAFDRLGISPGEYLSKVNLIAVQAQDVQKDTLVTVKTPDGGKLFRDLLAKMPLHRIIADGQTVLLAPEKAMSVTVGQGFLDRGDLDWHDSFAKPTRQGSKGIMTPTVESSGEDLHARERAMAMTWSMIQSELERASQDASSFLHPFLTTESGAPAISWNRFVDYVSNDQIPPEQRFQYLKWFLDLGRSSLGADGIVDELMVRLGADPGEATLKRTGTLAQFRAESVALQWSATELMLLAQFSRAWGQQTLPANVLDRMSESLDQWSSLESAARRTLPKSELASLENLLGLEREQSPGWFQQLLARKSAQARQMIARINEPGEAEQAMARGKDIKDVVERIDGSRYAAPRLNASFVQLAMVTGTLDLCAGGFATAAVAVGNPIMLSPVLALLFPLAMGNYVFLKRMSYEGYTQFIGEKLGQLGKKIQASVSGRFANSSEGAKFIARLTANRSKAVKACVLSITSKGNGQ